MSGDLLRAAAAKARKLADGVPVGPWEAGKDYGSVIAPEAECDVPMLLEAYGGAVVGESMSTPIAAYVVAWHPPATRLVAALLEEVATVLDQCYPGHKSLDDDDLTEVDTATFALARAILGEEGR